MHIFLEERNKTNFDIAAFILLPDEVNYSASLSVPVSAHLQGLWVRISPRIWISVCWECCVLSFKTLRRADHSPRGVLSTVVLRCVWSRNLVNEEALAHWGAVVPKTYKQTNSLITD